MRGGHKRRGLGTVAVLCTDKKLSISHCQEKSGYRRNDSPEGGVRRFELVVSHLPWAAEPGLHGQWVVTEIVHGPPLNHRPHPRWLSEGGWFGGWEAL